MKKILLVAILILGVVFYAAVSSFSVVGVFVSDGYILTGNEVQTNLNSAKEEAVQTYQIKASDLIYKRMSTLYVGDEEKTKLNVSYPMYINGGASMLFMDDESVLIDTDFNRVSVYDGLVLSEGAAFNEDGTRSDWNDYVFAKLSNGLYINSGVMELKNLWGSEIVPMNSFIRFTAEDGVSFYGFSDGELQQTTVTDVNDDTIVRIGSLEIRYRDLLLGLKEITDSDELSGGWQETEDPLPEEIPLDETEEIDISKDKTQASSSGQSQGHMASEVVPTELGDGGSDAQLPAEPVAPVKPEKKPVEPVSNPGTAAGDTDDGEGDSTQPGDPGETVAGAGEYAVDPEDIMAEAGDYSPSEYQPGTVAQSAPPAQAAAAARGGGSAAPATRRGTGSGSSSSSGSSSTGGLTKIPDYQVPTVVAGTDFTPGVYTLKTSVTITDPANVIIGGATYEITILNEYGKGTLYKRISVKSEGSGSQTVLISGLKPDSSYMITGTFRYKDEYGRVSTENHVFLEPREFTTEDVSSLGPIYLEPMMLDTAVLRSNAITVPVLKFSSESDQDAVGSLAKLTVRFNAGSGDNARYTNLSEVQLEKVMSYQSLSVTSPQTLASNSEYSVDVVCYDRYYNQLQVTNSHGTSRTCSQVPTAKIAVTANDDGSNSFTVTLTNPDNLSYTDLKLKIRKSDGTFASIGSGDSLPLTDGGTVTVPSLGSGVSFSAVVYAKVDVNDNKGVVERSLGSQKFTGVDISTFGPLYLVTTNITERVINEEISQLTDEDEIKAKKKELSTRAVLSMKLGDSTNPKLLPYVDVLTIRIASADDNHSITIPDEDLARLLAGEEITIDTNSYTYDAMSRTIQGLKSNTTYNVSYSAYKIYENEGDDQVETVAIRVSTTMTKFKTYIQDAVITINPDTEACYEGFIFMDIKIVDLDGIIGGDYAVLKVTDTDTGKMLGAFHIPKNEDTWYELRLTADTSISTGGTVYEIGANKTYHFEFIAEEGYPEKGYVSNYLLTSFNRNTGEALTGGLFNLGMVEDRSDSSKYEATFGYTLDVPTSSDFPASMKEGHVYVDKIRVRDGEEALEETIQLSYDENGHNNDKVWKATEEEFSDIALTTAELSADPDAEYAEPAVPDEYTQLDYLYTEKAYINTGILASESIGVEARAYKTETNSNSMLLSVMSNAAYANGCGYGLDLASAGTKLIVQYGKTTSFDLTPSSSYTISYNREGDRKLYVNDAYVSQLNAPVSPNYIPEEYFFLGGANVVSGGASSVNYYFKGRIYYCRLYDGDTLVRSFVPAARKTDGVVGFYDLVEGLFYEPDSGTFTAGSEMEAYYLYTDTTDNHNVNQDELPAGYTALEYLVSDGNQFIDLGVAGNSGRMEYQIKFNKLTGNSNVVPFGASNGGSDWSGLIFFNGASTAQMKLRGSNMVSGISLANGLDHEATIIVDNDSRKWESTIDGQYNSSSFSGTAYNRTIALFADHYTTSTNNNTAYQYRFTGRIYYFKMYRDNELIRDMVPCLNENNVPGMYDLKYKQFYGNQGTGSFSYEETDTHKLSLAVNYETFTTKVNKKDSTHNDSYIFRYYFYFAEGTDYAVKVPLSNVALSTEAEIYTIATGNEFVTKGASNRKYVVIDDIKLDNTNKSTYKLQTLRAQIDFQGFTFETYVNFAPIVYTTTRSAKISNLVLKEHVALNKKTFDGYYRYSESSSSTECRTGGALFTYFYGDCENLYIEYEQEAYPYVYKVGTANVFWSEIPESEILEYPEDEQYRFKFALLHRIAPFAVYNYGTIDRFVVDLQTDVIGETYMGGLVVGNYAGATISNGYVFNSKGTNNMAYMESYHSYCDWRTGYYYAQGGIAARNSATSTVTNCYALIDVVYNDSDHQAYCGGIVGHDYESGSKVYNSYLVGSTYYAATGGANTSYGPVVGCGTTGSKENDLYYITENTFGYTSDMSTEVTYKALNSEMWQTNILNSNGGDGFLVTDLVAVGCYPLVNWSSNCMPGQDYNSIIVINKVQSSFDIAYSFTYSSGIASIDKNPLLGTVGDEAWDSATDELSGYTQLEYIESTGTQYIDTGFIPAGEEFSLSAEVMMNDDADAYLFGAVHETDPNMPDDTKNAYALAMEKIGTDIYLGVGRNWKQTAHSGFSATVKHSIAFSVNMGVYSTRVDGLKASAAVYTGATDHETPVYVFASSMKTESGTSAAGLASMRLYSLTLTDGGVTKREFVPARRNSDGALGLYDKISKTFYTNAGTGTFKAGPECHYLESEDQVVCVLLADSDKTRIVYSIDIEGFSLSHDDVLYQYKDGSGINSVYVRVHNPEKCLSRYVIKSVTFEDDNGNPLAAQVVMGTRYANVEYYKRVLQADGGYGTNSWTYMQSKYAGGTYPENMALYADLDFTGISAADVLYMGTLTGNLKGNGHTLSNLEYDSNLAQTLNLTKREVGVALFQTAEGSISDLTIRNFKIEGGYDAGVFACYLSGATVDKVYVLDSYVGGGRLVGGFAADIAGSTVTNSEVVRTKLVHNAGGISTSSDNLREARNIGGFTGKMAAGAKLLHVFAKDIYIETLYNDMKGFAGGLVGLQEGSAGEIDSCYATGTIVSNATYTGGLVGTLRTGLLGFANTYADVDIYTYGSRASGLIGLYNISETYSRVGVAFGSIMSSVLYDPVQLRQERGYSDDRNGSSWFYGFRNLGSGTLTGGLYDGSRCYTATQNADGSTKFTDRYSNGSYAVGGVEEVLTLDTYKEGNVFGFLDNSSFSANETKYGSGELPVLLDSNGKRMPNQSQASIGGNASSETAGIFVDDSSIVLTDNGGSYTLTLRLVHGSDVKVTNVYTDFSYVDAQCSMDPEDGYASLTQGNDLVTSEDVFINRTINNQTTITKSGLTVSKARDLYYITAVEYIQDGETKYLKVGKALNIPQQWKTVANYDEYAEKVMGSHCENFRITGDLDFTDKDLRYNNGTINNMVNRMVGSIGFGSDYTDYGKDMPVNNYHTISGVHLDDTDYALQEDGCWQRYYFRGLISNVLSEFGCLTVEGLDIYGSGARFGLVGDCSGFIYDINFGSSHITTTASTAGLFGFVSEGIKDICIKNVTVEAASGSEAGTLGTLAGYARVYHFNNTYTNITARDCTVSGRGSYAGGLIGTVNNAFEYTLHYRYHFYNIDVARMTVKTTSAYAGDLFGYLYGVVSGATVTDSSAVASSYGAGAVSGYGRYAGCENVTVTDGTYKASYRAGGLYGLLDEAHNGISNEFIRNCKVSGCSISASSYTNTCSANRSCVGGLIGQGDYSTSSYSIKGCQVSDCTISGKYSGSGGIIGHNNYSLVMNNNTVLRCDIRALSGAGGLLGSDYYFGNNVSYNTYYSSNHVQDCTIYAESSYAGGFTGNGSRPGPNNMAENCWIISGGDYVGGVSGHIKNYGTGLSDESTLYHEMDDGNYCAVIHNCHIYGRTYVAGGTGYAFSYEGVNSTSAYAPSMILVDSCDIRGYSNVGGIAGYAYVGDGSHGADYITSSYVKDSVIAVPNDDTNEEIYARLGLYLMPGSAGYAYFGGIVGQGAASNNCLVENSVIGGVGLSYVGAIGGSLTPKYTSSTVTTARGNESKGCVVIGRTYVGGFYGQISPSFPATYNNSVSLTGRVTVADSFSDAKVIGENYVGGIAGRYSNAQNVYRRYDSLNKLEYEVSGQYTLPAQIKDLTFTGTLEATGSSSIAGGVFGSVSVYTPFKEVSETYCSADDRAQMQRMILNGVVIMPSYIKAGYAYPLFSNAVSGTGSYGIADLYGESSRQFVVVMNETQLISTATSDTETISDVLQVYPYDSCVGAYDTVIDANKNRTSSSRFMVSVSAAEVAADTDDLFQSKLLRGNTNMVSASAADSSFGKLDHAAIADYLPLVKFRIEGISHKANGKYLFGGYSFKSKTADPADNTTYYTLTDISQGLSRPGTAGYTAAQTAQDALYQEFCTTGTISMSDRTADMSAMLAQKIQIYPSAIDKISIEFPADFFTGTSASLGDYTLSSVSFSTSFEKTGNYSKITNETQELASVPVNGGAQVYAYKYNFVDPFSVLVNYKLNGGRSGTFTFVVDPDQLSTGNIRTRSRTAIAGADTYVVDDSNHTLLRNGYELPFSYTSSVPSKYQVLSSLKNDGTAYIDTGYVFKVKPTVMARMAVNTANDTYQLGFANNSKDYNFQVNIRANSSAKIWYKYGTSGWSTSFDAYNTSGNLGVIAVNTPYDWVFSDYISKDSYTYRVGMNNGFSSNTQSLRLFAGSGVSTVTFYGPVTLYDGDTLVGKLYPVKDTETGKLGMYDVVRKNFYTNANTKGSFTAGENSTAGLNYFIHLYKDGGTLYLLQKDGSIYTLQTDGSLSLLSDADGGVHNMCSADRSLSLCSAAVLTASASVTDGSGISSTSVLTAFNSVTEGRGISSTAVLTASASVTDGGGTDSTAGTLSSAPLYTFQYKGTEIETYGSCSIVGGKLSSDFLYYVKSGNLILVDRKLDPVANGVFAHYEGGNSYICVLTANGNIVSLGTVNLTASLEGFRNSGIVSLASNIDSESTSLVVEYADGGMAGYDAVSGKCLYSIEGSKQPGLGEYISGFIDDLLGEFSEPLFSEGAVEAENIITYMEENGTSLSDLAEEGIFDTEEKYGDFITGGSQNAGGDTLVTGETAEAADTQSTYITDTDLFVKTEDGTYMLASQAIANFGYEEGELPADQEYYTYDNENEVWILVTDDILAASSAKTTGETAEAVNSGEKAGNTITFTKEKEEKETDSNAGLSGDSSRKTITAEKVLPSELPGTGYDPAAQTSGGESGGGDAADEEDPVSDPSIVDGEGGSENQEIGEADGETDAASEGMMKKDASQEEYVAILNAETNSYEIFSVSELMTNPETVKSETSKVTAQQAEFLLDKLSAEDEQSASGFSMYALVIGSVVVLLLVAGIVLKKNGKRKEPGM